jgi:hypothetical protein
MRDERPAASLGSRRNRKRRRRASGRVPVRGIDIAVSIDPDADPELDAAIAALARGQQLQRRERRIWRWLILGGAIAFAAFLVGFLPVMQARLNAAKQLDQAVALLDQAAGTIATVDKTVTVQLSAEAVPTVPGVAAEILVARRELTEARRLLDDAMPHLTDDEQHRDELAQVAISARLTMIKNAPSILVASTKAVRAKALGDRGWQLTSRANAEQVSATRSYRLQTASAVETAAVAVSVIQGELGDASDLYSQAASAFPDAGFQSYIAYVGLRMADAAQLRGAATAWLGGDTSLARVVYSRYRALAAKSAVAAKQLPYAPGTATGKAFRVIAGSAADAYTKARQQAIDAEMALRSP